MPVLHSSENVPDYQAHGEQDGTLLQQPPSPLSLGKKTNISLKTLAPHGPEGTYQPPEELPVGFVRCAPSNGYDSPYHKLSNLQ